MRAISGIAIVLPANPIDFENVKKSIQIASAAKQECTHQHDCLFVLVYFYM
jgi:hypothetical protein